MVQMRVNISDWILWSAAEELPFVGSISLHVRTATECIVETSQGLPVAVGRGEQYIEVSGRGELVFACKTEIFIKPASRVQDRLKASDEVFTSYDRPAPLTPEMAAIQRMMRKNEIERERDRQAMETRLAKLKLDAERKSELPAQKPSGTSEKKEVRQEQSGSDNDATKQKQDDSGKDVNADRVPKKRPGRDQPSPSDG
ncbi:hypothetical protein [Microviridae sp.]|nr:hypothetical protein [Microviridae sp.]